MTTAVADLAHSDFGRRLRTEVDGEVRFDRFARGLYSADASIYQMEPLGVVVPKSIADVVSTMQLCAQEAVPVLARGAGTSQCGQTVNRAIVIDTSKFLHGLVALDVERQTAVVEPGIVLDQLNRSLRPSGLFFPVDPSTASRATIGGMTANNSSGARSIRYGTMVHNVDAIEGLLATGERLRFERVGSDVSTLPEDRLGRLVRALHELGARESAEIAARFPTVLRRVGGYNIDAISPHGYNLAKLLVGSEGTLAFFTSIQLKLSPIPRHRTLGVAHFNRFSDAMTATRQLVTLGPCAVELVDRTMIELARQIPVFAATMERYVRGDPDALLLIEFAGDDRAEQLRKLDELAGLMGDLGFPNALVSITDDPGQNDLWTVRKAGLDIMMSRKGDAKPVSVIEDCAVPLEHLAEYTEALNAIFAKYNTTGTWYAHASVGCLHVRPVLNMKRAADVLKLRAIAEEAFEYVRRFKGSHSGEHGDGIVRSEFHEAMFGTRIVRAFEEVKDLFDPAGLMNPGKIVRAPKMDDRSLFRYRDDYAIAPLAEALDWSSWGGYGGAVEMCNNNGACRKTDGVMCPSFMVTGDERHATRGRANLLRLALSGQLGAGALAADELYEALDLCVGCKGCRRECPTGVDMAKMKIEFLHHYHARHPRRLRDKLVAYLPRLAPFASKLPFLANAVNRFRFARALGEQLLGLSARRSLPGWRSDVFRSRAPSADAEPDATDKREVVLFVDTFSTYFEPENARAAQRVLQAAGFRVVVANAGDGRRPLCCGRTFLTAGLVEQARSEAQRSIDALLPYARAGTPIVGLEPSCLLTFRDEVPALIDTDATRTLATGTFLIEEFLAREFRAGSLPLTLGELASHRVLVHGHCHQKAFGALDSVETVLRCIPNLDVALIESSCCGMAGSFGYDAEHYDVSMKMAELRLLPAVRAADSQTLVVADGMSCRHQIRDGTDRGALHAIRVIEMALLANGGLVQ